VNLESCVNFLESVGFECCKSPTHLENVIFGIEHLFSEGMIDEKQKGLLLEINSYGAIESLDVIYDLENQKKYFEINFMPIGIDLD